MGRASGVLNIFGDLVCDDQRAQVQRASKNLLGVIEEGPESVVVMGMLTWYFLVKARPVWAGKPAHWSAMVQKYSHGVRGRAKGKRSVQIGECHEVKYNTC
jgi:hypothetical protein